ncbi:hypothetical protein QBC46DRAFT_122489 [Diplogelasinospora grovesii]|uniref:Uncharacterized protein n=1 Tax=Diplogelasinospora grovesii TaxID=303347 RepID=A0AAN6NAF5_9PEZI|nr:hypothetical protein QBC46DRAFT_122489 [Diplogelasinospora grovesii]
MSLVSGPLPRDLSITSMTWGALLALVAFIIVCHSCQSQICRSLQCPPRSASSALNLAWFSLLALPLLLVDKLELSCFPRDFLIFFFFLIPPVKTSPQFPAVPPLSLRP